MIKAVADMTNEKWSDIYEMNIYEFFNIVAFSRRYNNELMERSKMK